MNQISYEQEIFFGILLKSFFYFLCIALVIRIIIPQENALIAIIVSQAFVITIYMLSLKTSNISFLVHTFLIGIHTITMLLTFSLSAENFSYIWIFLTPLMSFLLISPRKSLIYFVLSLISLVTIFYIFNETLHLNTMVRAILFVVVITLLFYQLSKSREKAWDETEKYINSLEEKVKIAIKNEKEQKKIMAQTLKMATVGEMMSSIAHQWKQPLSSLSAMSAALEVGEGLSSTPNEKILDFISNLDKNIKFMTSTMDDFRNFFKSEDSKTEFSLYESISNIIDLFKDEFQSKNIHIELNKPEKEIKVYGFENMFKQAFLNILSNAKDAIIDKNPENRIIHISFESTKEFGIVSILDHAKGIPAETLPKIFKKGFTSKGDKGSGIGLAISKEIIEDLCNGKVSVGNISDGAMFRLSIPKYLKSKG